MFGSTKKCNFSFKMMLRLRNFLYVFNLRQGTILIAIHQIALSFFGLLILLLGISHAGEMLSMLHEDMTDDADRRELNASADGDHQLTNHNGEVMTITNNQRRFAKAQHLASVTVIFLYSSTIMTSIYLMACISLLHGAVKYKREFILPWIATACIGVVLLIVAIVIGDGYECVIKHFGGHNYYYIGCSLFVFTFLYAIFTVSSFVLEMNKCRCRPARAASFERGERLMLLDHVAHSSLLSAAQLNKISCGTRTQFV